MLENSSEHLISQAIVRRFSEKFSENLVVDAALVGGGPSALVAAHDLAKAGIKTAIFERHLSPGGGVWGGGMLFNEIVVQKSVLDILDEFHLDYQKVPNQPEFVTVDSVQMASGLIFGALKAGATLFNGISVEDLVFQDGRVSGLVINRTPVQKVGWFVDPLTVMSRAVLDGTGHPCEIINMAVNKAKITLDTPTGGILGERPMWADSGEMSTVENTRMYFPGLFASGMSANNVMGGYRMGPVFGGMLLSGRKAAGLIQEYLK